MAASGSTYADALDDPFATGSLFNRLPWATFGDLVLCGPCQSIAEREAVADRLVTAIESEIVRSQHAGSDPTAPEAALVALAMHLRERRERTIPSWGPQAERFATEREPDTRRTSRVAVTAAFLTGLPLRVRIGEYQRLQEDLSHHLGSLDGQGWSIATNTWLREGSYRSGGGFTNMLPLVLARRAGPDALDRATSLLYDRPEDEQAWLAERVPGWTITPTSTRVDVYDLGMAVMNITFDLATPAEIELDALTRHIKRIVWLRPEDDGDVASPIASALRALAAETTHQYAGAVNTAAVDLIERPWLAPFLEALPNHPDRRPHSASHDWGRLLWLHPVHLISSRSGDIDAASALVAPTFHQTVSIPHGRFVPGIGWSAVVTGSDAADTSVPLRLIELQWAAIALFMEVDRGLLAQLDTLRDGEAQTLGQLEADADSAFADQLRISGALARLDSELASLGGDEQALWDTISAVTKFEALINGVERKTDTLQRISERRVQLASAARARRTTSILSFLTALTVVTVAVALITNFLGSQSDQVGHLRVRLLIVAGALAVAVALYREAFRERPRRPRRLWRPKAERT